MSAPSRRTLLATAPVVAVAALANRTFPKALSVEPDPVLAAIEAHKAAMAALIAALDTGDADASSENGDAENDALEAVLTCQPTTQDGIIALLEHMASPFKDSTPLAFAFGAGEGSSLHQAACDLPAMIAETLHSLTRETRLSMDRV